ncbi:hypothetical protein FWC63_03285 [Candidatus Saccharibacteria bacterium]|nr:hypothetical protein [Candidatus Saccharibacteria bacterium]
MGERAPSGGGNGAPGSGLDTSALEAARHMLAGGEATAASSQLYTGNEAGIKTSFDQNTGDVDFTSGNNAASIVMADTTKNITADIRHDATSASAQDSGHGKIRSWANRLGSGVMMGTMVGAMVTNNLSKIPFLAPASAIFARTIGRVANEMTTRATEKRLLREHAKDTSVRHHDAVKRLSQEINIDGDKIALLNEGETRNEAKTDEERQFEETIRSEIVDYASGTSISTIPNARQLSERFRRDPEFAAANGFTGNRNSAEDRGVFYKEYQEKLRAERSDPEWQKTAREEFQNRLSTITEDYNTAVHKKDGTRGVFSANNFVQFGDACKDAFEMGASTANVRNGLDKVNMVFAEVASPVPEARMGVMDKVANKLHKATRGVISVEMINGVLMTGAVATVVGVAQGLTNNAARVIVPFLGAAVTAGAFAGFSEARRAKKDRQRAAREVAYGEDLVDDGEGGKKSKINQELKGTLMETKNTKDVMGDFKVSFAALSNAIRSKGKEPLSADARDDIMRNMVDFDQRLQAQVESGTNLFSYSSREKADGEFWTMRQRRAQLQDALAHCYANQSDAKPKTPEYTEALAAARDRVRSDLEAEKKAYLGTEASRIDRERARADRAFNKMRNKRVAIASVRTGAMIGLTAAIGPMANMAFGEGTEAAANATKAGIGAIFIPKVVRPLRQAFKKFGNTIKANKAQAKADDAELAAIQEILSTKYGMTEGTQQVDGSNPRRSEFVNGYHDESTHPVAEGGRIRELPTVAPPEPIQRRSNSNSQGARDVGFGFDQSPVSTDILTNDRLDTVRAESDARAAEAKKLEDERLKAERLKREVVRRDDAMKYFEDMTEGVMLNDGAMKQLFWDSLYEAGTPDEEGNMKDPSVLITPGGVMFSPKVVAGVMAARYAEAAKAGAEWAKPISAAEAEELRETRRQAELDARPALRLLERPPAEAADILSDLLLDQFGVEEVEPSQAAVIRDQTLQQLQDKWNGRFPGRALPPTSDLESAFERAFRAASVPLANAA